MNVIETIYIDTIEELHQFLSPVGGRVNFFSEASQFLFRGEETESYSLIPSLFRDDTIELLYASLRQPPLDSRYYQYEETYQWIELKTLFKFLRLANNAGIALPDTQLLQSNVLSWTENYVPESGGWLPEELLDLLSLARHYSFPTRMLDWSDNIYTALYFACSNSLRRGADKGSNAIIYALHSHAVQQTDFPLQFVRPLRFYNPNAHAQGGVLSYISTDNLLLGKKPGAALPPLEELAEQKINRKSLDNRIKEHFADRPSPAQTLLYRIILNKDLLQDLYLYLDSLHYSAERIYPDLYGVVRKMVQDEANWTNLAFSLDLENKIKPEKKEH